MRFLDSATRRLNGVIDTLSGRPASRSQLKYDATGSNGKRRRSASNTQSEDRELNGSGRKQVSSDLLDLYRNFGAAAWAMRRHTDFVATWRFVMRTDDDGFNREVSAMMAEWKRPTHCDVTGVHNFDKLLRLTECGRLFHGRCGLLGVNPGQLMGWEGDQIRTKDGDQERTLDSGEGWVHGVELNKRGRRRRYALHARSGNGYEFSKYASSRFFFEHGFYTRFNQVAGVSPLTSAVNALKDVYQGQDYALQKVKAAQLMGLVIYSDANDDSGEPWVNESDQTEGDDESEDETDEPGEAPEVYKVDWAKLGQFKMELEKGDKAEFLQDKSPAGDTVAFLKHILALALKSLDIPNNFWDEAYTTFFGSKAAWLLYERACLEKRADVRELLRRVTNWLLKLWIRNGVTNTGHFRLKLPRKWSIEDVKYGWIPVGVPWWKPKEELDAELSQVAAGLANPYDLCEYHGQENPEENWRLTQKFLKFCREEATRMGNVDSDKNPIMMPLFTPTASPFVVNTHAAA